ncbi:natural killer cell receptor 2B4 [Pluvialis apricaria]
MHRHEGLRYPLALLSLLFLALLAMAGGQGPPKCREEAVSADGALQLLPERPLMGWIRVDWRVTLDTGIQWRILTAEKNKPDQSTNSSFSGRAFFQQDTLSLRIRPVSAADSGEYKAEFEDASGAFTTLCFRVSVWEPVRQPHLETRVLHQEEGRCNLSLLCTVPGAGNVTYGWSCAGGPAGALEHHPRLQLQVRGDTGPTVCRCNASNPASWATASTDVAAVCRAAAAEPINRLTLTPQTSPADAEQTLTVYEEVGKAQTGHGPPQNGTSETTVGGNTIYTVISKTPGPSCPQEPESCTIYSTIQPSRKSSSLKKKRLDPALVSTAYVEATRPSRRWCAPSQNSTLAPAGHHLS